jgi:hypothetical protein
MTQQKSHKRLKFLTVIWGERYVEEFARVSLPSFMAPGNLPALAADRDLEILIMTTKASHPVFERQKAFRKLKKIAPVRFIDIDDLVTQGNYGVTLTYAYARGIMDSGEEQTNTTFVFMNADFVLSDGSLAHLLEKIDAGHPAIMSASLRACSEPVFPKLQEAVDPATGLLAMSSREMVGLALANLHPTVIGKTVTQGFMSCSTYNQCYWQVDENTLLGRYHLIFMLAISPEKPLSEVNSYCDYGFVPEMVPSGKFHMIGDSDEFFMLELAPTTQEREFLYCGKAPMSDIASALSLWTTKEHRNFATVDTVFHASELPPELAKVRQQADDYVSRLQSMMRREPVTHVDHHYWVSGVASWELLREAMRLKEEEARKKAALEKEEPSRAAGSARSGEDENVVQSSPLSQIARKPPFNWNMVSPRALILKAFFGLLLIARRVTGIRPLVAIWHHLWLDSALALDWARRATAKAGQRNLVIGDADDALAATLTRRSQGKLRAINLFLEDEGGEFDNIFLHVYRKDIRFAAPLIEHALEKLATGGELTLFVEHADADTDASNFTSELAQYASEILPRSWMRLDIRAKFVGGHTKRYLRQIERRVLPYIIPNRLLRIPLSIAAALTWSIVAVLTILNNAAQRLLSRRNPDRRPAFCTAASIRFKERMSAKRAGSTPRNAVDNVADAVVSLPPERRAAE